MKVFWFLLIILAAVIMYGCSSKQVYESLQNSAKLECQKLPHSQYVECVERASVSYDEYTRKRKETIEQK